MNPRYQITRPLAAVAIALLCTSSFGQSALLRGGDDIGGPGTPITGMGALAVNGIGGFIVKVGSGTDERVWGNHLGGAGAILFDETLTTNNLAISFTSPNYSLSDGGVIAFVAHGTDTVSMATGLNCLWTFDITTGLATEIARSGDPAPGLGGSSYLTNSNPRLSQSGILNWRASIGVVGGSALGTGLAQGTMPNFLVLPGDAAPIGLPAGTQVGFAAVRSNYAISANGTFLLVYLDTDLPAAADEFIVINGMLARTSSMTVIGEGVLIPSASGGLPGEAWDRFFHTGINESGDFFFLGETDHGDFSTKHVISLNGNILYRGGDVLDGEVLNDHIFLSAMNADSDIAHAWRILPGGDKALFVNDQIILREGDPVDWDGDGTVEMTSILTDFPSTDGLRMSNRVGGMVTLFFIADVDVNGVNRGGFFRMVVPVSDPFVSFCNGDGGDQIGCTDCPCGNNATPGATGGCLNSSGASSALLGSGLPSVSSDSLLFGLSGAPANSFALLSSGAAQAPTNPVAPCFGLNSGIMSLTFDGLRCAVQDFRRHGSRPVDANGDIGVTTNGWGPPSGPPGGLIAANGFVAGQTRHFQAIYRDDMMLGCGTGLNTSQGITVTTQL